MSKNEPKKPVTDQEIRELIALIDGYHGNKLKDRSEASVRGEIAAIRYWMEDK